jgi:replicative DNA helicase
LGPVLPYAEGSKTRYAASERSSGKNTELRLRPFFSSLLDDGLPHIFNLDSYVRIVRDKSLRRRTIIAANALIERIISTPDDSQVILTEAEGILARLSDETAKESKWMNPGEVMQSYLGGINAFMEPHTAVPARRRHGTN